MTEQDLESSYQRVLAQSRERGEVLGEPGDEERRRHPRIRVKAEGLQEGGLRIDSPEGSSGWSVSIDPWVFAIDISISGMAFYADDPVSPGARARMALGETASAELEVIDCHAEEPADKYQPTRYRLHCRFVNEDEGKSLLVAIKEKEGAGP